jgi:hypothetical protein
MNPHAQEDLRNATTAYHGAITQLQWQDLPQLWSWRRTLCEYGIRLIQIAVVVIFLWAFIQASDTAMPYTGAYNGVYTGP